MQDRDMMEEEDEPADDSFDESKEETDDDDISEVGTPLTFIPYRRKSDPTSLPKLHFMTEKESTCQGKFSERYDHNKKLLEQAQKRHQEGEKENEKEEKREIIKTEKKKSPRQKSVLSSEGRTVPTETATQGWYFLSVSLETFPPISFEIQNHSFKSFEKIRNNCLIDF